MTTASPSSLFLANVRNQTADRMRSASGFPGLFLALTWLILFPYQNVLDPRQVDSIGLSEIVATAGTGNLVHQVLAILLGAIGTVCWIRYGRSLRLHAPVGRILLAYVAWIILSVLWSDDPGVTLRRQVAFSLILVFCAGCTAFMAKEQLTLFIVGLVALNLIASTLQELIRGDFHPFAAGSRFGGTVSPNTLGAGLALAVIVLFWYAWRFRGSPRRRSICAAIVFLFFLYLTGSRTSLAGLVAALTFSALLIGLRKYRKEPYLIVSVLMLVSGGTAAVALVGASDAKFLDAGGLSSTFRTERDGDFVSDLTGRNVIWQVCLRYAAQRPVLGFGYGAFWTGNRLDAVAAEMKWSAYHAHCAYLDVFLQTGLLGTVLYILLVTASIAGGISRFFRFDNESGTYAALVVFLTVNGMTESTVVLPTFPAIVLNLVVMKLALN